MKAQFHIPVYLLIYISIISCNSRDTLTQRIDEHQPKAYILEFDGLKEEFYRKMDIEFGIFRQDSVEELSKLIKSAKVIQGLHSINPRPVNYVVSIRAVSGDNNEVPILRMVQYGEKEIIDIGGGHIYNYYESSELIAYVQMVMLIPIIELSKRPFTQLEFNQLKRNVKISE